LSEPKRKPSETSKAVEKVKAPYKPGPYNKLGVTYTTPAEMKNPPVPFTFPDPDKKGGGIRYQNGIYNPRMGQAICDRLMRGETLTQICKNNPRMPNINTVVRWLADPRLSDFRTIYYHARRVQAELRVDSMFDIMNATENDWEYIYDLHGNITSIRANNDNVQRARLKIDTLKWYASKMIPKIYGDHIEHTHDVTGDLADMLKAASNHDRGLPRVVNRDDE